MSCSRPIATRARTRCIGIIELSNRLFAVHRVAPQHVFLSIGFSAGIPSIPMHVIFNKNGAVIGVEPVADKRLPGEILELMQRLFGWYREGRLKPLIGAKYPLDEAVAALKLLAQRKAVGRILLDVRG